MYKVKLQILSILLIPVVLFSTVSLSIDKHICMDSVYSYSIVGEAEDCGMKMNSCEETSTDFYSISDEDCCLNETQLKSGTTTDQNSKLQLSVVQTNFIAFFVLSNYFLFESNLNHSNPFNIFSPPLVEKDISILFQVFII